MTDSTADISTVTVNTDVNIGTYTTDSVPSTDTNNHSSTINTDTTVTSRCGELLIWLFLEVLVCFLEVLGGDSGCFLGVLGCF